MQSLEAKEAREGVVLGVFWIVYQLVDAGRTLRAFQPSGERVGRSDWSTAPKLFRRELGPGTRRQMACEVVKERARVLAVRRRGSEGCDCGLRLAEGLRLPRSMLREGARDRATQRVTTTTATPVSSATPAVAIYTCS